MEQTEYNIKSKALTYWRGENYFKSIQVAKNTIIKSVYDSFMEYTPSKQSLKALKTLFPTIYRLIMVNRNLKIKDNYLYCDLQALVFRTAFYDIDLYSKIEDDLEFDKNLVKYFNRLFNTKGAIYSNLEMKSSLLGREELPNRSSSEMILFIMTLISCIDIMRDLTKSTSSITLERTSLKDYMVYTFKSCVGTSMENQSFTSVNTEALQHILRCQFNIEDASDNFGIQYENGILSLWVAWLQ